MVLVALFVLLFAAIFLTIPIGISLGGATLISMTAFTKMSSDVLAQLAVTGLDRKSVV